MQRFYEFGSFRIDSTKCLLLRDDQVVPLKPKAFETLLLLVQNSDRVMEKDELMKALWPNSFVEEANLTQHISLLRKALGESPSEHRYIVTAPGRGYRFVAYVTELSDNGVGFRREVSINSLPVIEDEKKTNAPENAPQDFEQQAFTTTGGEVRRDARRWPSRTLLAMSLLGLAAVISYLWISQGPKKTETGATRSIAVLPFKLIGAESGTDEHFSLGMADALITKLSSIRGIVVRPTSAVRDYTNSQQDARVVGRELEVESVLEGNIQKSGERIRVTVQLVSVRDGAPLWSESFDENFTDIFTVQDRVSEQVVRALALELSSEEQKRLTRRQTESVEAYQAYLRGRFFWNKRSEEGYTKALQHFQHAIELDPAYAQAYAGLADAYALLGSMGGNSVLPRSEAMPRAKAAAEKALAIDDTLAEAHTSLAFVRMHYEWDWSAAEREFRRAIEINPNYATAHHWYAYYFTAMGQMDEAIAEIRRAQEIDPLSLIINTDVGEMLYYARRYDEAIKQCRKTLEMDPNFVLAHRVIGWAYWQKGMPKEAIAELNKAANIPGGRVHVLASLGHIYAASGNRDEAQRILSELKEVGTQGHGAPYEMAAFYAGLGERDQAFAWLEKAYEERSGSLILLRLEPLLSPLRSDPRYHTLLRRMNLAP